MRKEVYFIPAMEVINMNDDTVIASRPAVDLSEEIHTGDCDKDYDCTIHAQPVSP